MNLELFDLMTLKFREGRKDFINSDLWRQILKKLCQKLSRYTFDQLLGDCLFKMIHFSLEQSKW